MYQESPIKLSVLRYSLGLAASLLLAVVVDATHAIEIKTELITLTDVAAPDGMGTIVDLGGPVLNDVGQVAFGVRYLSDPPSNGPFGLLLSDGLGGLVTLARTGDSVPDGNGTLRDVGTFPRINNAGQVVFHSDLVNFTGPLLNNQALYLSDGANSLQQIVRAGDPTPDGNGIIADFDNPTISTPVLNDAGQVVFHGYFSAFDSSNSALYLSNGPGDLVEIARTGDAAPDGVGTFQSLRNPSVNEAGQVAFGVFFSDTGSNVNRNGIFRREITGDLVQIIRTGGLAPDGNGTLFAASDLSLNDSGQIVFKGLLTGTNAGQADNQALYLGDGIGELVQLVRKGDAVPGGIGRFSDLGNPYVNNAGQTVFHSNLIDTVNFGDDTGLFLSDASGQLVQIAREGDAVPSGNGRFADMGLTNSLTFSGSRAAINDAGQVAFLADLKLTSGGDKDNQALYLYDVALGLTQLARTGEPLLGSTITGLFFLDGSGGFGDDLGNERSGLNDSGQVAYLFALADGREGIAIATIVPEPSTLLLILLTCTVTLWRLRFTG
ncbi:DUF7453 family protein [Aeoliella sp.]|uniref:DUF7453 family protein n=1 Tax=Aeoliella sp. TaxID=2795800 RepID=UPI003CCBFE44